MTRSIVVVGAPSSIGIRPYDNGAARGLDRAPATLRGRGLTTRLGARDDGDVVPPPYRDFVRPPLRPRNEPEVGDYSHALANRVAQAAADGSFVLVLGGDCSIILGCMLAFRRRETARVGLVYVDAHADFATPVLSRTGSAASMCLALAVGHGDSTLAMLAGAEPLVQPERVVLLGRRDTDEAWYGHEALNASDILDIPHSVLRDQGRGAVLDRIRDRFTTTDVRGFWLHLDADVIDPEEVPAVDSPTPNGLTIAELAALVQPLARDHRCLGLELTIYDPNLDPDLTSAYRLVALLEAILSP